MSANYNVANASEWYPREPTPRACDHVVCMSCATDPDGWRSEHTTATDIVVSGECGTSTGGEVVWNTPAKLRGKLSGAAVITGPCPLVIADTDAFVDNIVFNCTSGGAAVDVIGKNVKVFGTVVNAGLVRAVSVTGVDVDGLIVKGHAEPVAVLGHTDGNVVIDCVVPATVANQPLSGTASYGPLCRPIDIAALMGVFGRRYELEFHHKNMFAEEGLDITSALAWIAGVGALAILVLHGDVLFGTV